MTSEIFNLASFFIEKVNLRKHGNSFKIESEGPSNVSKPKVVQTLIKLLFYYYYFIIIIIIIYLPG